MWRVSLIRSPGSRHPTVTPPHNLIRHIYPSPVPEAPRETTQRDPRSLHMTRRVTFRVAASKVFGRKGAQAGSNHCLVGSKGFALGGSRAEPSPCFLPPFPPAGKGPEGSPPCAPPPR